MYNTFSSLLTSDHRIPGKPHYCKSPNVPSCSFSNIRSPLSQNHQVWKPVARLRNDAVRIRVFSFLGGKGKETAPSFFQSRFCFISSGTISYHPGLSLHTTCRIVGSPYDVYVKGMSFHLIRVGAERILF